MNRALWKPALVITIVLVLTTTSGLLLRGNTGSAQSSEVVAADEPAPKVADSPKAAIPPKDDHPPNTADTPKAAATPTAGQAPKPVAMPKSGDDPKPAAERRQLLETIGVLTAAHCYQTYFNLGLLADGRAKGTYTDRDASRILDSIFSLLSSVDRKLAALDKIELDKEDRASLDQMRELSALLRQQGKELQAFWDNGREEDATRYESVRKDSWAAISKLLGIGR
jgi:hypothetical protein